MKYFVYILKSEKTGKFYIGQTQDLKKRLEKHQRGYVYSTKADGPWSIIHAESFTNRSGAMKREREIKSYKGGIQFKKIQFNQIGPAERG